jgi:hypothetical protein
MKQRPVVKSPSPELLVFGEDISNMRLHFRISNKVLQCSLKHIPKEWLLHCTSPGKGRTVTRVFQLSKMSPHSRAGNPWNNEPSPQALAKDSCPGSHRNWALFFLGDSTGVWTQGFTLASRRSYPLSHSTWALFLSKGFQQEYTQGQWKVLLHSSVRVRVKCGKERKRDISSQNCKSMAFGCIREVSTSAYCLLSVVW